MTETDDPREAQLIAYLYGELEGDALREVEASLAESPERRVELRALSETLEQARVGLAALASAPPPRVSAALIAAAQATIDRNERLTHSEIVRRRWSYRIVHWALPALGVAAAVGLLVVNQQGPTVEEMPASSAEPETEPVLEVRPAPGTAREVRAADPAAAPGPSSPEPAASPARAAPVRAPSERSEASEGAPRERPAAAREAVPEHQRTAPAKPAVGRDEAPSDEALARAPGSRDRATASGAAAEDVPEVAATSSGAAESEGRAEARAPDAMVRAAQALLDARRFEDAARAYAALLARHPRDPRASTWRIRRARARTASAADASR